MLDKLSKKILRYLCSASDKPSVAIYDFAHDIDKIAESISADSETTRACVRFLEGNSYIKYVHTTSGHIRGFMLDHKGLHWKEFRRQEIIRYLEDKWIDFFSLAVSLCALVLSLVTLLRPIS